MSEEALGVELQRGALAFPRPVHVHLVDPDPTWVEQAELWSARLGSLPGVREVEHVGATAVPGLAAVPLIDLVVTADDPADEALGLALEARGFDDRGGDRALRAFRRPAGDDALAGTDRTPAAVDLRVVVPRVPVLDGVRRFRDVLRADAEARHRYTVVRRGLAGDWADLAAYRGAKGPVIRALLG